MPMIGVRDTRLYYETAGEGEIELLILHGGFAGAWSWEDQMSRLSSDFRCVAYDRRGHSRSEAGNEDQSLRTHVDAAAAVIDVLNLDRPLLVGTSAGGSIAVELLHRYPNLARGAVVSEPGLFGLAPGSEQELKMKLAPAIKSAIDSGRPHDAADSFFRVMAPQFWTQAGERTRERMRENVPLFFASLEAGGPTITIDDLASITHPVLVLTGSESPQFLRSIARTLVGHLPNARLVEFEGSGHVTHVEKPEEFAEAVRSFARETVALRTSHR